ncbi:MAG TPA: tripartite tricarboxylate transporter substrate binding protein [Casimicrobiaceae bacterium]|nr:tripartite tricarboxylate transporter substrate binding protein [Casimicrobiaceae bacterium]
MTIRHWLKRGTVLAAFAACTAALAAWPDRVITYVIPFAPGGESDVAARLQAEVFKAKYGKDMIIVNKPGAGGGLAWSQMNSTPGDGYTITGVNLPHIVLQPLEGTVNFKTEDTTPVYFFHYTPDAVIVADSSPFKTLDDLIKAAREKPEVVTFAGSGTNSANHAAWARFDRDFAVKTTYVPFKGTGDMVSSILGGHVSAAMSYSTLAIQQKGKMRMLAVASDRRLPQFPDVPTFRELGVDWVDGAYRGIGVPKSTPPELRKQISDMMDAINKDPDSRRKMFELGFEVTDIGYDQMPKFLKERTAEYMSSARLLGLAK